MRHKRWADALSFGTLVLLVLAFFWPLLSGRYSIPRGGGDLVSFLWPTWRYAARCLRQGILPLWNPTLYAGAPFAADNQSALFYPVNLLLFLLRGEPGYRMMEILVVFHMALAAVLMFLLLRDKGLSRTASLFGGLAFSLSDLFVTHIGNLNLNATIAYLPALILLADRAFILRSKGWAAAAGAVLAVAALAGHGQMLLFLGLALGLLAAYRLGCAWRSGPRAAGQTVLLTAIVALLGIAGAAVALFPNYELMGHTGRAALSLEEASRFSLPWRALSGLVAPGFYGRGPHAFWGPWDRVEVGYLGILPLALALGSGFIRRKEREGGASGFPLAFFAIMAVVGLALALGNDTPLYRLVHGLPFFRSLRAPARLVVLLDLSLAALAAYTLDHLARSRRAQVAAAGALIVGLAVALGLPRAVYVPVERLETTRRAASLAALLCVLGLAWQGAVMRWRQARWLGAVAVLILAFDLILTGSTVEIDRGDPWQGFRHDDVVAHLRTDPGLYRIDSSAARAWQPDAAAVYGLYDIAGISNPLSLGAYETYRWSIAARGDRLYSLLGVKYALADKGSPPGDQRLVPVYTGGPAVDIYLNTMAYPMAQLVYQAVRVESVAAAFAAIHQPDFDPAQVVVLQAEPQPVQHPGAQPHAVGFTHYSDNRISLEVSTPTPAYLLLSEVYYPGWRASVDGRPAEVLQADYLFRAIYLPAGAREVHLWFSPASFWVGLGLSLATWLGLAAWGALRWARRLSCKGK